MRISTVLKVVAMILILAVPVIILGSREHNTEQVCFDKNGDVIFYASMFSPSKPPVIELTENIYKIKETNEKIYGTCKVIWSSYKPKGRQYWESE